MALAITSLFPLAQKFPAGIFFRIGMQILVLPPQDSGETCLGILVRKVTGTRHRHGRCVTHMENGWERQCSPATCTNAGDSYPGTDATLKFIERLCVPSSVLERPGESAGNLANTGYSFSSPPSGARTRAQGLS